MLAYVAQFRRASFIHIHHGGATEITAAFDDLVKDLSKLVSDYELHLRAQAFLPQRLQGFQHYLARRDKVRRRF